jgi:ubiquinone/menaquinone biosynthesis C-methylase UbiE
MNQQADLVVADLFHIPFADNSVDVVYTSHSLEPNGGRE